MSYTKRTAADNKPEWVVEGATAYVVTTSGWTNCSYKEAKVTKVTKTQCTVERKVSYNGEEKLTTERYYWTSYGETVRRVGDADSYRPLQLVSEAEGKERLASKGRGEAVKAAQLEAKAAGEIAGTPTVESIDAAIAALMIAREHLEAANNL